MFDEAGVDLNRPMVASCLTGLTACGVAGAAHILGKDIPVYYVRIWFILSFIIYIIMPRYIDHLVDQGSV